MKPTKQWACGQKNSSGQKPGIANTSLSANWSTQKIMKGFFYMNCTHTKKRSIIALSFNKVENGIFQIKTRKPNFPLYT